jgi:uncharacterized protein
LRAAVPCIILGPGIMASHEFSVPAGDLDAAGKHFRFAVRASWIRGILEGTDLRAPDADGEFDVRLSKCGTDVVVRGALTAELNVPCARCLQPARAVVSERISALVVPAASLSSGTASRHGDGVEEELIADQADVIAYDGETVVLDDLVRDELLLGIPMIPLCSVSCPGIRPETMPESASAPGVDPRFRPLLRFKKSPT